MQSFKELTVWQKSIELVKEVYRATESLPKSELYGLVSQMRRSSVSISSNIAEGYKRKNRKEYIQFLSVAEGSSAELETQVIITKMIYPSTDLSKVEPLITEVQKMLWGLLNKLKAGPIPYALYPYTSQHAQKTN